MKIIPLAVPTPFYVGDVNVYLIKEDPLTLIDTGPKTEKAAAVCAKNCEITAFGFQTFGESF
jgi:glyoxylase-like metal-dependent hydrolase (beta-lactamase superfamily II)